MPPKRKREETDTDFIVRSPDIWFTDGNVILEAEKTHFLVHRSVLMTHSEYFQETQYENIERPIVTLNSSANDLLNLLKTIYGWPLQSAMKVPLLTLLSLLKLASEYRFIYLRDEARSILSVDFPDSLEKWDLHLSYSCIERGGYTEYLADIQVLNAVKTASIRRALPVLYYKIISENWLEDIIQGQRHIDGILHEMSDEDKLRCAMGHEKARLTSRKTTYAWLDNVPYPTCQQRKVCPSRARRIVFEQSKQDCNRIHGLDNWEPSWDELCDSCRVMAKKDHDAGRMAFWEAIPGFFGLPSWAELVDFN